jgi:hypothetical protein
MDFGTSDAASRQSDDTDAFELSPPSSTVTGLQVGTLADGQVDGDAFYVRRLTKQLKVHGQSG